MYKFVQVILNGDYWLINDDNFDDNKAIICKKFNIGNYFDNVYDLHQYIIEEKPYILVGEINNNIIYIDGSVNFRHSDTSIDLKKLKKELKLPIYLTYLMGDDYKEYEINTEDLTYYHGTCTKYLDSILKYGIMATNGTNFKNINHDNMIFITSNIEKAYFHAQQAAINTNTYPIIIETKIPDFSKIDLDYDLAIDILGIDSEDVNDLGFDEIFYQSGANHEGKTNLTYKDEGFGNILNKIGIFSYKGRIPASNIKNILIDDDNYGEYFTESEFGDISSYISDDIYSGLWDNIKDLGEWVQIKPSKIKNVLGDIEHEIVEEYNEDDN